MRTRCPQCATVFRITPEQLRARGGKVRCGSCQGVFNAFDHLQPDPPPAAPPLSLAEPLSDEPARAEVITVEFTPAAPVAMTPPVTPPPVAESEITETQDSPSAQSMPQAESMDESVPEPDVAPALADPEDAEEALPRPDIEAAAIPAAEPPEDIAETPEQSTQAAREAGLVAVRDLSETPSFNRWAAGTLAGNPLAGLESEATRRSTWPFTLAALILAGALLAQLGYHFRTELVQRFPSCEALFGALDIEVPLPRQADQVSIEASDLQSDNGRGLLILSATLKNRATGPQAWPALELTLTDSHDAVVARRVLQAPDYLPPKADAKAFSGQSEIGLRLWIEAKETPAAGYRLYVFYP